MAKNAALGYGIDIACISDADDLFSEAEGLDVVMQDALHAITQEDFLGEGGDGRGKDIRRLIGAKQSELESEAPIVADVLTRDDRILDAEVQLTATTTNGLSDVLMEVRCNTPFGPFSFTRSVLDLTTADLEAGTS